MTNEISYETYLATRHLSGLLPDHIIQRHIKINPMVVEQVREENGRKVISYGSSSYGHDIRLGYKFKVFTPTFCTVVDPKNFDENAFVDIEVVPAATDLKHQWEQLDGTIWHQCKRCNRKSSNIKVYETGNCPMANPAGGYVLIPPNSFALGESLEELEIPRDVLAICLGKSTMARCGIIVNVTPLEPEWKGKITIEISNTTPLPAKIYAGEGICQLLFFRGLSDCRVSYADKAGRYQDQQGITLPSA